MQRLSLILAAVLPVLSLSGATITDAERNRLLDHLKESRKSFAAAITGLTPQQAAFKPAPDQWSVLECAEHLAQAEQLLLSEALRGLKSPPAKSPVTDEHVLNGWGTRIKKVKSSGSYDPRGRWPDLTATLKEFDQRRARTAEFVAQTQEDLRGHLCSTDMDVFQQILGISAHTVRHTDQINEVKASPGFPKQ